ncbi:MAG: AI-2E family transporter [Sphingobacteriaceae bacterium]|nr:MAG: AI-2E family transporter [Sphingobacteriaceae bacterium]
MSISLKKYLPLYAKWALVLFTIISIGFLIIEGKQILCPLVFSMLFSLLLLPVGKFLEERFHFKRSTASILAVLLMLTVITLILYLVGSQVADLLTDWPNIKAQLNLTFYHILDWVKANYHVDNSRQLNLVHSATGKITSGASTAAIGITLLTASQVLLFWVFVIIDTFFLLFYRRLLLQFLVAIFSKENAIAVFEVVERIKYIISKYILGLMLEMMIVSSVCCTVFLIGGLKYALLLGLITGLFNIIPYVGIATALFISTLITLSSGVALGKVILVVATIVIMHLIDSNVLLPMIVGSKVRINALITILGVVLGEMLWGIPGMFLSIPVIAILKIIFDRVESLQPWGLLLGDEVFEEEILETKTFVEEPHSEENTSPSI